MRLAQIYIKRFQQYLDSIVGSKYELYLFGSRVSDLKKGGDIDLLLVHENEKVISDLKLASAKIKVRLCDLADDQKVDILFCTIADLTHDPFIKTLKDKILLC